MEYNTPNCILTNQNEIEEKIAYNFGSHTKLLIQAFTRKSFSQENEGFEDNEVLEFYGDQLVNTVLTKWCFDSFTIAQNYSNDFFRSTKNEAELTKIRANYINKSTLAHCIEILELDEYLLLGKSDEKNEVWENEKVRCDLFEAIIGAIAVDSKWDFDKITKSCKAMWSMLDFEENYISQLYNTCEELGLNEPRFSDSNFYIDNLKRYTVSIYFPEEFSPKTFNGKGSSEISAKMDAAKQALNYLQTYQIEKIAEQATPETAVQTLNTLFLKKFISKPEWNIFQKKDENGNQIWRCECFITDFENQDGYDNAGIGEESTKAQAKQQAAFDMICFILGYNPQSEDYSAYDEDELDYE